MQSDPGRSPQILFLRQVVRGLALLVLVAGVWVASAQVQPALNKADNFERLLRQGFDLHRQQQYHRSIPLLEQARALKPRDYLVNLLLGMDYLRSRQASRALPFLEAARDTRSGDPTALGYLAEAYASMQQFSEAAEALQSAAYNPKASAQEHMALVEFYLRRFRAVMYELRLTPAGLAYAYRLQALRLHGRRHQEERELLLRVQALAPQFPGLESSLGMVDLMQGEFDQAAARFRLARSTNPDDPDVLVGDAILAVRFNDFERAESLLSEVAGRSRHRLLVAFREWPSSVPLPANLKRQVFEVRPPKEADPNSLTARELFQQQRWETLVETLGSKKTTTEESLWLGISMAQLDRCDPAIPPLERGRRETRQRLEANYWLSLCYARAAEEATEQLRKGGRDSSLAHVVKGEVLLLLAGDGPAATAEYRQAVAAYPRDPAVWSSLAAAQLVNGDTQAARNSARKALQLDPGRALALRTFAEASIQERDYARAIPPLRQVLDAQPDDVGAQVLLGTAYARTGQDKPAARFLQAALDQRYPDEKGTLHYLLGSVLRRLGHEKEAEQAFEQAQALSNAFARSPHGPTRTSQ